MLARGGLIMAFPLKHKAADSKATETGHHPSQSFSVSTSHRGRYGKENIRKQQNLYQKIFTHFYNSSRAIYGIDVIELAATTPEGRQDEIGMEKGGYDHTSIR